MLPQLLGTMSAACSVISKDFFFFLLCISHLHWFQFLSSWSLSCLWLSERKGGGEGHEELGSVLAGEKIIKFLQLKAGLRLWPRSWDRRSSGCGYGKPFWGKGAWCCLCSLASCTPRLSLSATFPTDPLPSSLRVACGCGMRRWSRGQEQGSLVACSGEGAEFLWTHIGRGPPLPTGAPYWAMLPVM